MQSAMTAFCNDCRVRGRLNSLPGGKTVSSELGGEEVLQGGGGGDVLLLVAGV